MELLESWLGALAMLTEPYWLTLQALGAMIVTTGTGTAIFGGLLLFLSLDLLRGSSGPLAAVWRVATLASSLFILATLFYGDFLAAPAKAAYTAIVARSPSVPSSVVALSTLSAAGAGLIFYAGRQTAPRSPTTQPRRPTVSQLMTARREVGGLRVADFSKSLALDPAGRLQLRQLSHNAKKVTNAVRPALRYAGSDAYLSRLGRRYANG